MVWAVCASRDRDYALKCVTDNARMRLWLRQALLELGIGCDESHTNFVLARFASATEAEACDAHLRSERIIVRRVANYGLPEALRITVGDESACRRVVHAIAVFKGAR